MITTIYALTNDKAQQFVKKAVFTNDPKTAGDVVTIWRRQGFLVNFVNET